jgi:hypothetical protein
MSQINLGRPPKDRNDVYCDSLENQSDKTDNSCF